MAPIPQPDDPSPRALAELRDQGLTVAEIASQLGVSSYRIRQALKNPTHRNGADPVRCTDCATELAPSGATASETRSALCIPCLGKRPVTTFAQRLLACRLAAGLSRGQVAARAGGSESTIRNYEAGRYEPGHARRIALANVLGPVLLEAG
jgi:transcriptional regulator with XRE-family HTH domain